MNGLQITFGGGVPLYQALLTALMPALVGGGAALLGVWLTNNALSRNKKAEDRRRAMEKADEADAKHAVEQEHRGFAALEVAEHLETYVLRCNEVVASWSNVEWVSPMEHHSFSGDSPLSLTTLPDWPHLIDWPLLGVKAKVEASNFKRRTELIRLRLDDLAAFNDHQDQHCENADRAARLAIEAWEMAVSLRAKHRLEPMAHPYGWDLAEAARDHIEKRAKIEAFRRGETSSPFDPVPANSVVAKDV